MIKNFNPRTRTGCDPDYKDEKYLEEKFQSTHPHGVRLLTTNISLDSLKDFNPRTRTGCDYKILLSTSEMENFNPRTRTGCDLPFVDSVATVG